MPKAAKQTIKKLKDIKVPRSQSVITITVIVDGIEDQYFVQQGVLNPDTFKTILNPGDFIFGNIQHCGFAMLETMIKKGIVKKD